MKKSNILTCVMAVVAIIAIIFGIVTNGQKADLSKQVEELKANVATLTGSLDAAKQEVTDAVAAAKAEGEAALAAAKEEAEKAIAAAKEEAEKAVAAAKEEAEKAAAAAQEEAEKAAETAKAAVEETVETVAEANESKTMTHADFVAAELETEVTVETYVQAKQGWWDNKATIYTQAEDGAYFLYNMAMSQEDYDKLVPGAKIRVTGYKSEWSGEVEIIDATFEILEADPFIAEPEDVTALLGSDDLIVHQNERVAVKGAVVAAKKDANGNDAAFLYNWDGSGSAGNNNDLYFDLEVNGAVYSFTVESYLCGEDTEVYQAVTKLNVGDKIDVEGFLYWYNGAQPHVTAVKAAE